MLRVCQDPNNLPFSNRAGEGFENKIAELFGARAGTGRSSTTRFRSAWPSSATRCATADPDPTDFQCDIVMGVPAGFEQASTTKPYYRSTYALVFPKGKGLDSVTAPEDLLTPRARPS